MFWKQPQSQIYSYILNRQYCEHSIDPLQLRDLLSCQESQTCFDYEVQSDKIFASRFLTDSQVLLGSKCKQLTLLNVDTGKLTDIPLVDTGLKKGGIYSITRNSNHLVTNASGLGDTAVYHSQTLKPLYSLVNGHTDQVFGSAFIQSDLIATCGRDGTLAYFRLNDQTRVEPLHTIQGKDKIRAMLCHDEQLALLSPGVLKFYNHTTLSAQFELKHDIENVAMAVTQVQNQSLMGVLKSNITGVQQLNNLYAVGSQSHIDFIDPRVGVTQSVELLSSKVNGVRSLKWFGDVLTIGGGCGSIRFYDIRAGQFRSHSYQSLNAAYAIDYDSNGSLLTAGGPLQVEIKGSYVQVWK